MNHWDKQIKNEIYGYGGIDRNALSILFNQVIVKDQYDKTHLICKYIDKFYIKY